MSAVPYRKVDRNQVYQEISEMIKASPDRETEVSSSDLADKFGVQAPTMDYHLNKLVEEGLLSISPKRGRYKRKIYRLPQESIEPTTDVLTPESTEKFKKFLDDFIKKGKKGSQDPVKTNQVQEEIEQGELNLPEEIQEDTSNDEESFVKQIEEPIQEEKKEEESTPINTYQEKELTLDERIQSFLNNANQVHEADTLLKHEDKEILSVMNESIHENMVYLKDLSEQLSTLQNKELIQNLIDDRNRTQKQMEHLEKELEQARKLASEQKEKYDIDPNRVRFMQQLIVSTIDDYVNQPNHAIALGRKDFRKKASKEVSDLVQYVLGLER